MTATYAEHANICAKFYSLTVDGDAVADFVFRASQASSGEHALFVGSMFNVAAALIQRGLDLTVIDYTEEMVELGRKALPQAKVLKCDLSALAFQNKFDLIFVVGRVFTHMVSEGDLLSAISGCKNALRANGRLFIDNYEDSLIQKTNYFNGIVKCEDQSCTIERTSNTNLLSTAPFVVRWDAKYSGNLEGKDFNFEDSIQHRAFSRSEFAGYVQGNGLNVLAQGDNFDETSFFTLCQKVA